MTTAALPLTAEDIDALPQGGVSQLERDRPLDLRHAVRARPRSGQALGDWIGIHRPRQNHDDYRAGDYAARCSASGRRSGRRIVALDRARPAQALEDAIKSAAGYPELAEEVRMVQGPADRTALSWNCSTTSPNNAACARSIAFAPDLRAASRALEAAQGEGKAAYDRFMARLRAFRVLDPACGSGNFLYLALVELKNIERRVSIEGELLGFPRSFPAIGPEALLGIEINAYAAELARVSVWIGEIQWMRRSGFDIGRKPILKPLDTIRCQNAIIADDESAIEWPPANVIVGNPPYLGAKLMKRRLGMQMTDAIRALYDGRLPGFTDLVCYWFENARAMIEAGIVERAGLVATNSIRKNTNLPVMHRIAETTRIFEAWSEEQWTVDGAAVDVSLICFGNTGGEPARLDGDTVAAINPDLTSGLDLTLACPLKENRNGAFPRYPEERARSTCPATWRAPGWRNLQTPMAGATQKFLKPYWNGDDLTGRPRDMWFIDLPLGLSKADASLYAKPFRYIATTPR